MVSAFILLLPAIAIAGQEEDAWVALNNNDYAKAYELFLPLAEKGDDADAANVLAWLNYMGKGRKKISLKPCAGTKSPPNWVMPKPNST